MDSIDKDFFYSEWRSFFGKLQQPLVDRVEFLLGKYDASNIFDSRAKISYSLATIKRETAETFAPVEEGYWITKNRIQKLYNYYKRENPGALKTIFPNGLDGINYLGRGYVQLTHDYNYMNLNKYINGDLLAKPEQALEPNNAFTIMEVGMSEGIFTGKKLSDYFFNDKYDFYKARKIINGLDAALEIQGNANKFFEIIRFIKKDEN